MRVRFTRKVACGSVALGAIAASLLSTPASAQQVEEIIVTAQRRQENLQNVPIAVTAVNGAALEMRGIAGSDDLGSVVSGLNVSRHGPGPQFFLRGVGTTGGQIGQDQAVSIFIDGVYQPSVASGNMELSDVERIEVLKGPQGTLFGRNATGGVINVITKTPGDENSVNAEVGYGNYDTFEGKFFGNVAYSDRVAQTVAVYYQNQRDGYGTNLFDGSDVNKSKTFAARSKLRFDLGDSTTAILSGDYTNMKGDLGGAMRPGPESNTVFSPTLGWSGGFQDVDSNIRPIINAKNYGASLTLTHDFDFAKLTSISAWRHAGNLSHVNLDMTSLDVYQAHYTEDTDQYSQELQLSSNSGGKLEWTVGLFYLNGKYRTSPLVQYGGLMVLFGVPAGNALVGINTQKAESIAGYGQATYSFTDSTRLTLGLRYTEDTRKLVGADYLSPIDDSQPFDLGPLTELYSVNRSTKASKPTWRIVLDHEFAPDVMAYVGYNRGFKSGLYNNTGILSDPVRPEILDAFEGGLKSKLFDNRVRLNLSAFLYKYKDIQLSKFEGGTQALLNAAKAEMYGLDADFEIAASSRLTLNGGATYLHARFESFPDAPEIGSFGNPPGAGQQQNPAFPAGSDLTGNTVPKSPEFTVNLAANYLVPLASSGELAFNVSYNYNDGFFWEGSNRTRQKAYSLVNGQVTWTSANENLFVRVWGKNIFDTKHYNFTVETVLGDIATAAAPRTYGVSVGFKY